MRRPQVIVAHPGKQHAPQTAFALQEGGMLAGYYTSLWYKPDRLPYALIPKLFPTFWASVDPELRKRFFFAPLDQDLVHQFPWFQGLRVLMKWWLNSGRWDDHFNYLINRTFDLRLASKIGNQVQGDVLIGYEMSSLYSFLRAQEQGKLCILDLAISAWPLQNKIKESEQIPESNRLIELCNKIKQRELEAADYILGGSRQVLRSLQEANINQNKTLHIPYGINTKIFQPKQGYPKRNKLVMLFVGVLSIRKGVKYLLEAVKQISRSDIELIMVGGMGDASHILEQFSGHYRHIPFISQAELARYYQDADVFVFPSLLEGFAQVTIEAMASGTPVIVSDHAGSSDAVIDGVNGFVVPIRDVETLKEKILFFYHNRHLLEVFGRAAAKTAQDYTWEIYRQRIRDTVVDIFNDRKSYQAAVHSSNHGTDW